MSSTIAPMIAALALAAFSFGDAPAPLAPVPSPRQLARQEMDLIAFVHFGMNTFTDREWGQGHEDEKLFAPSDLDCKQWARAFADAGVKGVVLTCKHHDGFCLWPSKFTEHSVKNAPWKAGGGDVVRDLSDACKAAGIKFGVYLSPWDRTSQVYGDSDAYNDYYANQLTELLSNYGDIFEVWWDGACGEGPNGKRQVYDWPRFTSIVRKLQPNAVIFSDVGPDIRWVGNEGGIAGETCWGMFSPDTLKIGEGGHEAQLNMGQIDGSAWIPAECDVSIRPGWFHHATEDALVRSVDNLVDIYEGSVGRGANLLLNVPADKRGLLHEVDVARLKELRHAVDETYKEDLGLAARALANHMRGDGARFGPDRAVDGDPATYWAVDDDVRDAQLVIFLASGKRCVDRVVIAEPIALGQRIEHFTIDAHVGGAWKQVASGTTVGRKRIVKFAPIEADAFALHVEKARACPLVASFSVFEAVPKVVVRSPDRTFVGSTVVELAAEPESASIEYTLVHAGKESGTQPYKGPFQIAASCTLRAVAKLGSRTSLFPCEATFTAYRAEDLRPPIVFFRAPDAGLRYEAFGADWQTLDGLKDAKSVKEGVTRTFDLELRTRDEHCALAFSGFVNAPKDGIYTFATSSDDGSRLYVDDTRIVENDGLHAAQLRRGEIGLRAGFHKLRVEWFNGTGSRSLDVQWSGPGFPLRAIPAESLAR